MGNSEAETPAKPEKPSPEKPSPERPSSPLPLEQPNVHVYPDWAAMQAYYGAGVALPPPYFGSAVPPGHPSHPYMWGPQPMMPPYGSPYAAMYPHGGMYAHPSLSLGAHGHAVQPSPVVASPLGIATPSKSTSTKDKGSKKRLKGSDGLAVSIGNGNDGSAAGPESEEDGVEGSSDGSDGNTEAGGDPVQRKRSRDATLPSGTERKVDRQGISLPVLEAKTASNKSQGSSGAPEVAGMVPLRTPPGLELIAPSTGKRRATAPPPPDAAMPARDSLPPEVWMKDERALKREKRKQSNRESARRSRLRKQAESEELALRVESLNAENLALRSEINRLTENSENLKIENAVLMGIVEQVQPRKRASQAKKQRVKMPRAPTGLGVYTEPTSGRQYVKLGQKRGRWLNADQQSTMEVDGEAPPVQESQTMETDGAAPGVAAPSVAGPSDAAPGGKASPKKHKAKAGGKQFIPPRQTRAISKV